MKFELKVTLIFIWLNLYNLAKNETSTSSKKYKIFTDFNINECDWLQFLIKQFISMNKLQCLAECQKNPDCNLVSFNKMNNYCKLYSDYLIDETNLINSKGNMIYSAHIHNLEGVVYKRTNLNSAYVNSIIQLSNRNIACGLENGTITILSHVDLSFIRDMNSHTFIVYSLANLKNGYLVSGSWDFTIKIWDHLTGTLIKTLTGHTNQVNIVKVLSNNDIVSGSDDKTVLIWDSLTGLVKLNFTEHTNYLIDLTELANHRIVSLDLSGIVKIWNYLTGDLISSNSTGFQHSSLTICMNGDYVFSDFLGSIRVYDSTTFNLKHDLVGHTAGISKIIKLKNGDLCSSSYDDTIKVWDFNSRTIKLDLIGHGVLITSIIQLHNGYLVGAGGDSTVIIWK